MLMIILLFLTGYSGTNRINNMIMKLRGNKIPTVRWNGRKIPLLPNNVGGVGPPIGLQQITRK